MRSTLPVLGVLGEVQHVVVNAGEEGQECFTVHGEGRAHQLVSNFVGSLGFILKENIVVLANGPALHHLTDQGYTD